MGGRAAGRVSCLLARIRVRRSLRFHIQHQSGARHRHGVLWILGLSFTRRMDRQHAAGWVSSFDAAYLFSSAVLLQDVSRVAVVGIVALVDSLLFTPPEEMSLVWTIFGMGTVSIALALYKRYIDRRMSSTMRHNVLIRSQAARGARSGAATHGSRFSRWSAAKLHQLPDAP